MNDKTKIIAKSIATFMLLLADIILSCKGMMMLSTNLRVTGCLLILPWLTTIAWVVSSSIIISINIFRKELGHWPDVMTMSWIIALQSVFWTIASCVSGEEAALYPIWIIASFIPQNKGIMNSPVFGYIFLSIVLLVLGMWCHFYFWVGTAVALFVVNLICYWIYWNTYNNKNKIPIIKQIARVFGVIASIVAAMFLIVGLIDLIARIVEWIKS